MINKRKNFIKPDWLIITIYILLAGFGIGNILSSSISGEEINLFEFNNLYSKQLVFFMISLFFAFLVMTIGKRLNGALSWYDLGGFNLQPSEFVKITVALAISKYISDFQTDLKKTIDQFWLFLIILSPVIIIILQNDTGSSLVFFCLFIVFYREGISQKYLLSIIAISALAIFTLKFSVLHSYLFSLVPTILFFFTKRKMNNKIIKGFSISCLCLLTCFVVDYSYKNILRTHQQNYIKVWLNLEKNPSKIKKMERTILYNLNESKKAISSGGIVGKGYMKGTRTMGNFVPAQHSDYIFSTIGEEWGFTGSTFIIILYCILIYRIVYLSELQKNKFSRVYGYSTASILFIHFCINIGMVLGLTPTIGIPLPFLSYGGSSLIAFTILLFIFIRFDANKINEW